MKWLSIFFLFYFLSVQTVFSQPIAFNKEKLLIEKDWTIKSDCTLKDCVVEIEDNITITIQSGATLIINASQLRACHGMWAGIVVEPGGSLMVINNSKIDDARTAIFNESGAIQIEIRNSSFNRDSIALSLSKANYGSSLKVSGTYFNGGIMRSGNKAWYAIKLSNATGVTIGEPTQNPNTIEDFNVGLFSSVSNAVVVHTDFKNITSICNPAPPPGIDCSPPLTSAIYSIGNNNQISYLKVGGTGSNEGCTFTDCKIGIKTILNIENTIVNNTFTIDTVKYRGSLGGTVAVDIFNNKNCNETVSGNHFKNYQKGIQLSKNTASDEAIQLVIHNNLFNQSNASSYIGSDAIWVRNSSLDLGLTPQVEISQNSIYNYKRGILTSFLAKRLKLLNIRSNDIFLNKLLPSTSPMYEVVGLNWTVFL